MKIAICMSGQLREWEWAKENQRNFWYSDKHIVDYFVHTWTNSADRNGGSTHDYIERNVSDEEFNNFVNWYTPKKIIFDDKPTKFFYENDHWMCLFYSMVQSFMLKKEYELETNTEYDIVIKTRPDLVFDPDYHFSNLYLIDGFLYTTHMGELQFECNMINVNDTCFYANSYTIDILINLYNYRQKTIHEFSKFKNNKHGYLNYQHLGPGVQMGEYCRDYGLTPHSIQFTHASWMDTILRMGAPKADLSDSKDFKKIRKYFNEWYSK